MLYEGALAIFSHFFSKKTWEKKTEFLDNMKFYKAKSLPTVIHQ